MDVRDAGSAQPQSCVRAKDRPRPGDRYLVVVDAELNDGLNCDDVAKESK